MEVLPVCTGAQAVPWNRLRLTIELAHGRPQAAKLLRLVLDAGALNQLDARDLVFQKADAARDQPAAAVLDHQRRMVQAAGMRLVLRDAERRQQRHRAREGQAPAASFAYSNRRRSLHPVSSTSTPPIRSARSNRGATP